jgi:outer membrane usher protein FimD/PapC
MLPEVKTQFEKKNLVLALTFSQIWLNPLVDEHQPPTSQN